MAVRRRRKQHARLKRRGGCWLAIAKGGRRAGVTSSRPKPRSAKECRRSNVIRNIRVVLVWVVTLVLLYTFQQYFTR
jgi:hypothetical protein